MGCLDSLRGFLRNAMRFSPDHFVFGCAGSSLLRVSFALAAARGGSSLAGVHGLLIAMASLVEECKP